MTIQHTQLFTIGSQYITISYNEQGATLQSNLSIEGEADYNMAIDGMEALLLAFAVNGLLTVKEDVASAINTAIEGIANNID